MMPLDNWEPLDSSCQALRQQFSFLQNCRQNFGKFSTNFRFFCNFCYLYEDFRRRIADPPCLTSDLPWKRRSATATCPVRCFANGDNFTFLILTVWTDRGMHLDLPREKQLVLPLEKHSLRKESTISSKIYFILMKTIANVLLPITNLKENFKMYQWVQNIWAEEYM